MKNRLLRSPYQYAAILIVLDFMIDALLLILLDSLPSTWMYTTALLHPLLDIILLYPVLYYVMVRPLSDQINERKNAEAALREANEVLARTNDFLIAEIREREQTQAQAYIQIKALEASANGMVIANQQGCIEWLNPAFTRMTGYTLEEVRGENLRFLKSGLQPPEFYASLWETILSGQVWHGELINRRKNGTLYAEEMTISPVITGSGEITHFIAVKQDITTRRADEEKLERYNQELLEISRLEREQRRLAEGLVQAIQAVNSSLDLDKVFERILEQIMQVVPCRAASVMLVDGEFITRYRHLGFTKAESRALSRSSSFKAKDFPVFHKMIQSGEPCLIGDVSIGPEWQSYAGIDWIRSYLGLPLVCDGATIGLINLHHDEPGFFQPPMTGLLQGFAGHAVAAISNARHYAKEANARQVAEALRATSLALSQSLDLEKVLNTLLDHGHRVIPYDSARVMLFRDEDSLAARAWWGYETWSSPAQISKLVLDVHENSFIAPIVLDKRTVMIEDTSQQPDWKPAACEAHVRACLGVPLLAAGRVIGILILEKARPGFFTPEYIDLAEMLVSHTTVVVQNSWLFEQVRTGHQRLQQLSHKLVETQEKERSYIARELHDEVGQALTSLMVGLQLLEKNAADPVAVSSGVGRLCRQLEDVSENLHRLAMNLRPASLDYLGLVVALRQQVASFQEEYQITAEIEAVNFPAHLPPGQDIALYRIVQEALTNVARHAHATQVDVLLEQRGQKLVVMVEDNGVGFDPQAETKNKRMGLYGLRERTEMMGGRLTIESAPGKGSTLLVEIPVETG